MEDLCPVCGRELPSKRRMDKTYCSGACRQKAMRERKQTMETDEGQRLLTKWREDHLFNRLAIHYLTHVYTKYGAKEAEYAAKFLAYVRDGLDIKDP